MRYVIFPGYVRSKWDKDLHYISANNLIQLYGVNPKECKIITEMNEKQHKTLPDDIELYPDYSGNYSL